MKAISDFPDLKKYLHNINVSHFEQGLSPNIILDEKVYVLSANSRYIKVANDEKKHLLYFILSNYSHSDEKQELYNFAKQSLLELVKTNQIEEKYLNHFAFLATQSNTKPDLLQLLLENDIVNANLVNEEGYSLLMCTKEKAKIDTLIKYGADINVKVTDKTLLDFDKTAYEMALQSKKKGWIEYLKHHLSKEVVENKSQESLQAFKNEKKVGKQLKLYIDALKQNNLDIINEIKNHQDVYHNLITYHDGHGNNLIHHAISKNSNNVLEILVDFDYYQNNKSVLNTYNQCYTTQALSESKNLAAKILFLKGFKDEKTLIRSLNEYYYPSTNVMNLMIDEGYTPDLNLRAKHFCYHKLEEEEINQEQIDSFFNNNTLNFSNIKAISNQLVTTHNNTFNVIHANTFKILSIVLVKQKVLNPIKYQEKIERILGSLGINEEKLALKFSSLIVEKIPEEKQNLIDYLGSQEKRAWLVKLTKEKLEKSLLKYEEQNQVLEPRKMKI